MKRFFKLLLVSVMLMPYVVEPVLLVNATSETILDVEHEVDEYVAEVLELESIMVAEGDHGGLGLQEEAIEEWPILEELAQPADLEEAEIIICPFATLDLDYLCGPDPFAIPTPPPWNCAFDRGWCWTSDMWETNEHTTGVSLPRSNIMLPNRQLTLVERADWISEYWAMGGPSDFELLTIEQTNEVRTFLGLIPVQLDPSHMMAARFYAQTMANLNVALSHTAGPYGGSAGVGTVFGVPGSWRNGAGAFGTPEGLVVAWMNSPGHCRNLLQPGVRYIGTGSHAPAPGGGFHYMYLTTGPAALRREVEVENGTGGGLFATGETVSVRATIPSGHQHIRWEGTVNFANESAANTTFIMPANAVTVRAIIELVPGAHTVTFDFNGGHIDGSTSSEMMVAPGVAIGVANVPSSPQHDNGIYIFAGWQENGAGSILTREQVGEREIGGTTSFVAAWVSITEWEQLREHISGLTTGEHTIRLTQDISATGNAIQIPAGRNITLESANASMQTLTQTMTGQRHFIVGNNASLTLESGITLSGGLSDNTNNAGGIQVNAGGTFTMEDGSVIENSHRTVDGGAIAITGSGMAEITRAIFFVNGGAIRNNSGNNGGGVSLATNSHMYMAGGVIENNRTTSTAVAAGGGGVRVTTATATFTMTNGLIRGNHGHNGGGVSVTNNATFHMEGTAKIENNTATAPSGLNSGGGGVAASGASFTMSNGIIYNNEANTGGGVLLAHGSNFVMSGDAIISDNTAHTIASNNGGGGIKVHLSTFTMEGGIIHDNLNPRGAGILIGGGSHMDMSGGVIYNNTASTHGGGVSVGAGTSVGTFTMSGGTIVDNTSTTGGGVHVGPSSTFIMNSEQALIEDNQANTGGGVGLVGNAAQGDATFNLIAGTIEDNQANSGGGIHIGANAHFEMSGGYIRENRSTAIGATAGGGGISQIGGIVIITDGMISHNTATNQGGGVRVSTTTNAFTMTGGTISHNTATNGDGGGVFTTAHTNQSPLPEGMHYTNITIGANVNFSYNTAGGGAFMPPNNATTATNIAVTATRSRGLAHALNNLDINFRGGVPIHFHTVRFLDGDTLIDSIEIQEGELLTAEDIPADPEREDYDFIGWTLDPAGTMPFNPTAPVTGDKTVYAQWRLQEAPRCLTSAIQTSGQLESRYEYDELTEEVVDTLEYGAQWWLCEDGTLEVGEGFINNRYSESGPWRVSPWHEYRAYINRITFTGEMTAGESFRTIFHNLPNLTEIEGLAYIDTSNVTNMSNLFSHSTALTHLDLSNWNTTNVRNMTGMFGF